jgi:hypothetical protein
MMGMIAIASKPDGWLWRAPKGHRFFVLPTIGSIAFLFIADGDGRRGGIIRVLPQNLMALSQTMKAP